MNNIDRIIMNTIDSIEETCVSFYQQRNDEGYLLLDNTIKLLMKVIDELYILKSKGIDVGINENELMTKLSEAMNALQIKDTILLSDIMQFEVLDLIKIVQKTISHN